MKVTSYQKITSVEKKPPTYLCHQIDVSRSTLSMDATP